ncbi:peroxidase [Actinoplanes sp. OR16]|uniref:Dyp-type peroxidase n=1 Tax=Actinoplanes sp. OR16 TaxID=946334 RepID=UPI000F6EDF7C|nr:Dyp-type peroxidase [Actinoplanes sp. OR16]BBH69204.1 peroxidase [Actinoplanes sp. OR16]
MAVDLDADVQGNVLRPFEGSHQAFLVLTFGSRRAGARTWLSGVADRIDKEPGLLSVSLTATGLVTLRPGTADHLVIFEAFWKGPLGNRFDDDGRITSTAALLGDVGPGDPMSWVVGGPRRPPVDALLTVAADDLEELRDRVAQEERAVAEAGLRVAFTQYGAVIRNADGKPIEHFGFVEGIANPVDIATGEFVLGLTGERRPLNLPPRPTPAAWMHGGSFHVFRRLRQDVQGWWDKMAELSDDATPPEEVAARAIGRRLDGTPLAGGDGDDFTFRGDEDGARTPLYAHIRKMNPRRNEIFRDRSRRILRRGIPYGRSPDPDAPDGDDRGMLFNAYMASIEDQFEFLQRCWANDPGFPSSTVAKFDRRTDPGFDGMDPVIGHSPESARRRHGDAVRGVPALAFGGFVTTTGSIYAFAPSRPALRHLAGDHRE